MIAEALNNAEATWLITGLGAIAFLIGIAVGLKKLFWEKPANLAQPFLIAMEKEFVNRQEYDRRQSDLETQVKNARSDLHTEVHGVRIELQSLKQAGETRDQLLHAVDERTKNHTRVIDGLGLKLDRVVDRVADKVESILRKDRAER